MANKRAPGKKFIGGYVPAAIRDRFKKVANLRALPETDALIEAMTDYADRHENDTPPETTQEHTHG